MSSEAPAASMPSALEQWFNENNDSKKFQPMVESMGFNANTFEPYEVKTENDKNKLIRYMSKHDSGHRFFVRGRDKRRDWGLTDWDYGIAFVKRGIIYIKYKSGNEKFDLQYVRFLQVDDKQLVEVDATSVLRSMGLYFDEGDDDFSWIVKNATIFKEWLTELPTFLKYRGIKDTILTMRMQMRDWQMGLYFDEGDDDFNWIAEDATIFKEWLTELPTFLKYSGIKHTIFTMRMQMRDWLENESEASV